MFLLVRNLLDDKYGAMLSLQCETDRPRTRTGRMVPNGCIADNQQTAASKQIALMQVRASARAAPAQIAAAAASPGAFIWSVLAIRSHPRRTLPVLHTGRPRAAQFDI
jgi:hypothetical protein